MRAKANIYVLYPKLGSRTIERGSERLTPPDVLALARGADMLLRARVRRGAKAARASGAWDVFDREQDRIILLLSDGFVRIPILTLSHPPARLAHG